MFRYQDMLSAGRTRNAESLTHIPNIFIWHPHLIGDERNVIRVNYYTSAVGTDESIDQIRDKIASVVVNRAGVGRRICPHVFKKPKASNKAKLVDISIAIDALRDVYRDQVDLISLFSGDGDYIPLIKEMMRNGKQVIVGALSSGLHPEMRRVGDQFIDIDPWFFL